MSGGGNNNAVRGIPGVQVVVTDLETEMRLYDALPRELRDAIKEGPMPLALTSVVSQYVALVHRYPPAWWAREYTHQSVAAYRQTIKAALGTIP